MIKTPGSHTDRIAQACDRCRSKKIRCDGKRPHCSQCLAVGFECKTSDKLSRRAYPRGYTESLEDRVRQLESENTKLTNLLDIKDEQMEMLSKVDSLSPHRKSEDLSIKPPTPPTDSEDDEAYFAHQINTLSDDGSYHGSSAGGVFIEALFEKLKTKNCSFIPQLYQLYNNLNSPFVYTQQTSPKDFKSSLHFPISPPATASPPSISSSSSFFESIEMPSRLSSDKLISTYFHEWNTMHAVLDQYEFLDNYQLLMNRFASAEHSGNYNDLHGSELTAIVVLIVASLGSVALKDKSPSAVAECWKLEKEWKRLFSHELQIKPSLLTVQALVLAQLYSLHTGQQNDVWHYRMMSASMCQRLGLQRCHKSLKLSNGKSLSFYQQEMRRRVFWAAYTLDCFAAALLGAPRLLMDKDIECALPSNIDDDMLRGEIEDDSEKGVASTTQMTCPLTVIYFAQVLGNILDTIYAPAPSSHTYKTVVRLEDKLEQWRRELPSELRFEFANGAPGPALAPLHQKSPLLLILYHYARILIHIPAISPSTLQNANSGARGSTSFVAVMQSAKVALQVTNYLKARCVIPCLSFNPARMSVFFASIVLYGAVDYSKGGALLLDIRKILASTVSHLCSDLQLHRPGSLTPSCFQIFEESCDNLLNAPAKKTDTTRRRRSSKKKDSDKEPEVKIKTEPVSVPQPYVSTPKTSFSTPPSVASLPPLAPAPMPTPSPSADCSRLTFSKSKFATAAAVAATKKSRSNDKPAHSPAVNTPPTKTSKPKWTSDVDILRDSAINDLLMINLASSKSRSASICVTSKPLLGSCSPSAKKTRSSSITTTKQHEQPKQHSKSVSNPIDIFFESGLIASGIKSKTASTVNLSLLTSFEDDIKHHQSVGVANCCTTQPCDSISSSLSSLNDPLSPLSKMDPLAFHSSVGMDHGVDQIIPSSAGNISKASSDNDTLSPGLTYSDDHVSLLSDPAFSSPELLEFFSSSNPTASIMELNITDSDTHGNNKVDGDSLGSDFPDHHSDGPSHCESHLIGGHVMDLKKNHSWDADLHLGLSAMNWNGFEEIHLH